MSPRFPAAWFSLAARSAARPSCAWVVAFLLLGSRGASPALAAPAPTSAPTPMTRPVPVPASVPGPIPTSLLVDIAIEDPGHKGLDRFHRRLLCLAPGVSPRPPGVAPHLALPRPPGVAPRLASPRSQEAAPSAEDPRRLVRVAHYGDSIIAADRMPSGARQLLQGTFGDGGHGFLLLRAPNRWYHRAGALAWGSKLWVQATIQNDWMAGRRYGYGGGLARTSATGAAVHLRPKPEGSVGGRVSHLVVLYESDPRGGVLTVTRAGVVLGQVDTRGRRNTSGRALLRFPEGPGDLKLALGGGGTVRLHGVALEREGPGIVWDGLGLTGARYHSLARLPISHFQEQLRLRPADLVVFQYGANISDLARLPEDWYRTGLRKILSRLAPLRPRLSCLVVGPVDRGFPWKLGWPSRPIVKDIERVQREEAHAHGCAFFSAREAMGGEGSAARWARGKPPLIWGDLTHLRPLGAHRLGQNLGRALLTAHRAWRRQHPQAHCPGT